MYLISRTLCQGRAAGIVSLAGTTTGLLFYAMAAAFGLTAVFVAVPVLFDIVRWAGAAYLLWLAWDAVRPQGNGGLFARRDLPPVAPGKLFRTGVLTSILNPKVALFYLALFPQFVDPSRGSVLVQSLFLARGADRDRGRPATCCSCWRRRVPRAGWPSVRRGWRRSAGCWAACSAPSRSSSHSIRGDESANRAERAFTSGSLWWRRSGAARSLPDASFRRRCRRPSRRSDGF